MRGLAHLAHLAFKGLARKSVYREGGFLAGLDAPHIRLVNAGIHLHIAQVFGNHKQLGRLQAGCYCLAFFNGALDHNAVHRRGNAGAVQVNARLGQRGLSLGHVGLRAFNLRLGHAGLCLHLLEGFGGGVDQRTGLVALALGDELFLHQALLTLLVALGFNQIDLRARHRRPAGRGIGLRRHDGGACGVHIGLGRAHAVFKGFGVNHCKELPGLDLGVEVHQQVLDLARHLRTYRYLRDRVHRATGRHRGLQTAPLNFAGAVLHVSHHRTLQPPPSASAQRRQHHHTNKPVFLFHGLHSRNPRPAWTEGLVKMRQMKGLRDAFDPLALTFRTHPDAVRRKSAAN